MNKDGTYNGPKALVFRNSEGGGNVPEFFRNYYPMFVSFARNFAQSREVCEDLVQEAFVALLEQGCTFDNEYLAKGFLYKTLRNKCLNHLRHEQIRNRYAEMQAAHYKRERNEKKSEEFFIDAIMREESSLIISQAIEGLPEMGRQVLNMSVEGLSNQEIADVLGISINTVRTHKSRAYKVLRIVLSNQWMLF